MQGYKVQVERMTAKVVEKIVKGEKDGDRKERKIEKK